MTRKDPQGALFEPATRRLVKAAYISFSTYSNASTMIQFSQTRMEPFQVTSQTVGEIPFQWLTDHGFYACFRAALTIGSASREVRDAFLPGWRESKMPADPMDSTLLRPLLWAVTDQD